MDTLWYGTTKKGVHDKRLRRLETMNTPKVKKLVKLLGGV